MGSVAKLAPLWSESTPSIASGANRPQIDAELQALERLGVDELRLQWRNRWGRLAPAHLSRPLLFRAMAYRIQAEAFGDLDRQIARRLDRLAQEAEARMTAFPTPPNAQRVDSPQHRFPNRAWPRPDRRVATVHRR